MPSSRLRSESVTFSNVITFKNVNFGYDPNKLVFQNINCTIKRGDIIIIKGKSGCKNQLGESGGKMSGGQKQRLSIALTLYSDSNLLILDEPTSSLVNKIASDFVKNLISCSAEKTILIIDHRGHFEK